MIQSGADLSTARYRCRSCGFMKTVPLSDHGNAEYEQKKCELLARFRLGFVDWRVTQWTSLQKDLLEFMSRYEEAESDIRLQMGVIACMTSGFQLLDDEKYKQCERIFKATEKMYKHQMQMLKQQSDARLYESVSNYKELRVKYKKCRNEYRNTKLLWKIVFAIFKKCVFH